MTMGEAKAGRKLWRAALSSFALPLAALPLACGQQPTPGPASSSDTNPEVRDARKLVAESRFAEAESRLRTYLHTHDLTMPAHELLAYALLRQNKPVDALAEYTRAAALQPPSAEDLKNVAQAYALLGDYKDADKWNSRAVAMAPRDPDAWYNLGRIRYTDQKFEAAAQCFERVLSLVPHNVKAENNLGLAYEGMNRQDEAVAAYRQAIEWQEQAPPKQASEQPLLNLGIILLHRGELAEAEPLLLRAVEIAPSDPRTHEQLGHLYLQKADFSHAASAFAAACELDPKNAGLHFLLGKSYRSLGRKQEADAEFKKSAQLSQASAGSKTDQL